MKPDYLEVFGGHVKACGLSGSEIDAIKGVYPARHLMPTFAGVAFLDPSVRIEVGGWSSRAVTQDTVMPNLYSAARLREMASAKERMVNALAAFSKSPEI